MSAGDSALKAAAWPAASREAAMALANVSFILEKGRRGEGQGRIFEPEWMQSVRGKNGNRIQ